MVRREFSLLTFSEADDQPVSNLFQHYAALLVDGRTLALSQPATLTLFAPALLTSQVVDICHDLRDFAVIGPLRRHTLSERWEETVVTADIEVLQQESLHTAVARVAERYRVDVCVQVTQPSLQQPGLLVMDMDSTVIQIECIDEIAKLAGVGEQVASVTARAMRGELAFRDSLLSRVACLDKVDVAQLADIKKSMPLMPGVARLVAELKRMQWRCTIASGGFTYFADYLKRRLGLDDVRANVLEIHNGQLTGRVIGDIVDAEYKAECLRQWREEYGIRPEQVVAMGDGANDLVMMKAAGLGVACHAKPVVNASADVAIRFAPLHALLYLFNSH